ncbi:MAG: Elongation factor 1-alpha [Candidatus Methanofastidiosum methylothiophilum]|uniref:Elongation factor 1-alpha n=1 Tax=Candidatus Methanofastidiosum methylothiophilum TaxID=1705564 RepID=A0A150JJ53_9EURY|nr:MAG: Elongation factor 1-alpha [Candidatus Methanofastidiosum methylthiophilus]MBP6931959.1 translation elongation factor EF-1 subunit alpha [Methanofastidiosum sp.]OQC52535.1 MAG: Elongation factor 1-alpha [Euryarchaeota archaeon ADurb.Bin023]KYC57118.1 MAG: Elongation factor 1-alpha [Candidatus Methanofastidiosum methylthiophilus]KYC57874.1 MAG: Elongation factor 1-alpha [Candidatus Methanofastidiosum methylthiophilus]
MATQKPHLNVAFIGHVDHGKSTSVGQLLVMHGDIRSDLVKKFEVMGEKGKTFKFAWVMDNLKEERERGVTIDLSHKKFETDSKYITIVDCPGHRDFVKNMITGASQADAAVLVVAVNDGIMPQTQEHVFLSRTLGIQQLAVLINKMDTVNYSQEKFNAIKAEVEKLIRTVGFKVEDTKFIPASAFNGDNIVAKSDKTPWYTGPSLLEAVDSFKEPDKPTDKPLRLPIQDVYTITGVGTVPVGRVETGIMKKGDTVVFEPASTVFGKQIAGEVKTIEMHHETLDQALPGDNVGFNVRGVGKNDIKRGDVLGHPNNPPTVVTLNDSFKAQIVVLRHPTAITAGYTPVFHCHTAQIACTFEKLIAELDPKTGNVKTENPDFLKSGSAAIVQIKPTKPMVIEEIKILPQLGRFAVRDMGATVAAGMVQSIQKA